MRTIREWQRDAYALAVEKGFHSRECTICKGAGCGNCGGGAGNGRVRIDPHSPTRIASRLALIHCEISEAVECVARGEDHMALHWVSESGSVRWTQPDFESERWKPEGFPIELADVFLRLCDLAESLGVELPELNRSYSPAHDLIGPEAIAAALQHLHGLLSDWTTMHYLRQTLIGLYDLAARTGIDLLAMAELKHEFNRTRPIMHGGKVL